MSKLQIIGLKIQDLRNIDLVDVSFRDKNWIEVTGKNGAAKSTLLDAIFLSITGTKYLGKGYPAWRLIKSGKDRCLLKVTLGNDEREIEIKRSIGKKGETDTTSSLVIKDTAGEKLSQAWLDHLLSEFTVDPLSFAQKNPKQQIEIVKKLSGIDTDPIEQKRAELYQERTYVNRKVKDLAGKISGPIPPKVEEVQLSELLSQQQKIETINREKEERNVRRDSIKQRIDEITAELQRLEIEQDKLGKPEIIESTEAIRLQIQEAEKTNTKAREYREYAKYAEEHASLEEEADQLTEQIKQCDAEKEQMIANSKLPFKNIAFDSEAGVLIDGIPFSQHSTAEQLRISARIGMEINPDLRVICIKAGSALDEKSVEILRELANKNEYQILVERVGETPGEDSIVMRAGRLISEYEKEDASNDIVGKDNLL
jgi:DNA repair exonuclease SbcCD ATPase subunit